MRGRVGGHIGSGLCAAWFLFAVVCAGPAAGQQTVLKLDVNTSQANSPATTEGGFTSFVLSGNPASAGGVTIFFQGALADRRRDVPTGIDLEQVLRDFVFGNASDVRITLSGLQSGTAYNVIMYAYDAVSGGPRHAVWTANGAPLFETYFDGGIAPTSADDCKYTGTAVSDVTGTIVLQSARGAFDGGPHWAFVNGLILEAENPCYNAPPVIGAPGVIVARTNTSVFIDANVTDDGKPYEQGCDPANPLAGESYGLTYRWVQISGPAPITLEPVSADVEDITALFPLPGAYELALYVSDGPDAGPGAGPNDAKTSEHVITIDAQAPLQGDINGDGYIDLDDLCILAAQWLDAPECVGQDYCADLDASGNVAGNDFAILSENWLIEHSQILINEFVASNQESLRDGDGNPSDWIELYNADTQAVTLAGWYLTDDADNLRKWPFPPHAVLAGGGYLIVFASGQSTDDYVDSKGYLHTNFALSRDGEYLALVSPGGRVVHEYGPAFPPQQADISYGMWHGAYRYFALPTPGAANQQAFLGFTDKPSHSHKRGFYDEPFELWISCETPGAVIRYTLDGSEPGEQNGLIYDPDTPVAVATTALVRSVAFKPGWRASKVATHSYIFVNDVALQPRDPAGWPAHWGYSSDAGAIVPADYEMDPRVVNSTLPGYSVQEALLDIPTVSISMAPDDFISDTRGIYANPLSRWERKCSMEYILPSGADGFQEDCKIEVHGNASRRPARMQKHSLRVTFTSLYGSAKLKYPLFAGSDVEQFNQLVLRACFTDSWGLVSWDPTRYRPNDSQYTRDVWMKESLGDMGQPSSHGSFVHVYVNGLYFGLHNLTERLAPDFFADHLGGRADDWQINADFASPPARWNAMMAIDPSSAGGYAEMQQYLDVENFADYILLHLYADAEDWPVHNGYAGVNTVSGDGRFRFLVWDQEIVLDYHGRAAARINSTGGAGSVFQKMRTSSEFRLLFADRVHKHCFNDGALSQAASQSRYRSIADMIDRAIVAESARWGDTQVSTPYGNTISQPNPLDDVNHLHYPPAPHGPAFYFTREDSWLLERDNVINNYIPAIYDTANSFALINLLRANALYPAINPPLYRVNGAAQHGGYAPSGSTLTMLNPNGAGTIYYTLDGADPRTAAASNPASNRVLVAESAPKNIWIGNEPAAAWTGGNEPFDDSAWTHGNYIQGKTGGVGYDTDPQYLPWISYDVKSLMYYTGHAIAYIRIPFVADPAELAGASFIKLRMRYDDGFVAYLNGFEIARSPGVTENPWATISHEATGFDDFIVTQHATFRSGKNILAIRGLNKTHMSTDFLISAELVAGTDDQTPPDVSGTAMVYNSAVVLSHSTPVKARVRDAGTWSALSETLFAVGPVREHLRITELMYHPAEGQVEYIELQNIGSEAIDLAYVSFTNGVRFTFPSLILNPGAYTLVVADRTEFENVYGTDLNVAGEYTGALDNSGERIRLADAAGSTIHDFRYSDGWFDITDGGGFSLTVSDPAAIDPALWGEKKTWKASTFIGGSPGGRDDGPNLDDIVINELLAHSNTPLGDWIELHNTTDREIAIGGWFLSDRGATDSDLMKYRIADGTTLAPHGYIVFYETLHFNNPADPGCRTPFALSQNGETVYLSGGFGGELTGWRKSESFGASLADVAFGRYRKSTGAYNFVAMSTDTPGGPNAYPAVGPVVISEIMYHPANSAEAEYVELLNISASPVALYDYATGEPWKFTDDNGIDMVLNPAPVLMAAGERILLVQNRAAFEAEFGAPAGTQILEWMNGSLSNAGEQIQLSLPGDVDNLGRRQYIRVDRVVYSDGAHPAGDDPWPASPDGQGQSLTRVNAAHYGNDVVNWQAAPPSPGR
ncbi:MAG: lamin tail domain-containing protein [Phycisphaerae bacterium]|nr:lamin tail domain-containing protein [Phycisphaerae bacterium]